MSRRRRPVWPLVGALTALVVLVSGLSALQASGEGSRRLDEPPDVFDHDLDGPQAKGRGAAVVGQLASINGTSSDSVSEMLDDPTVRVSRKGRISFVDPEPAGDAAREPSLPLAAPFPYARTFQLHSKPGSQRVIYLDFNGHSVVGTQWNASFTRGAAINATPYTIDGDTATFTTLEQDVIQSVWQRVAEDYAPFDVDVTTQDPGQAAITRSGVGDLVFGTRVVITNMSTIASDCDPNTPGPQPCGGIAYLNVFSDPVSHDFYQPAFVFSKPFYTAKDIAEAASHEVGHNLGLHHDGTASVGYYAGQGAWAPIMGVGYYKPVTQWSKGEYTGANNHEDDLAIIAAGGAPLRPDDHKNNNPGATSLGNGPALAGAGIIGTSSDVDTFVFQAAAGPVSLTVRPAPTGPDLDIRATLRNSAGVVMATADPLSAFVSTDTVSGLGASISMNLAAGTYYLSIDGVGAGSPTTNGYSDYASLGAYSIVGTIVPSVSDVSMALVAPASAKVGTPFAATLTVTNRGPAAAAGTAATLVLPANLAFVSAPAGCTLSAATVRCSIGALAVGASRTLTVNLRGSAVGTSLLVARATTTSPDTVSTNNVASRTVLVTV